MSQRLGDHEVAFVSLSGGDNYGWVVCPVHSAGWGDFGTKGLPLGSGKVASMPIVNNGGLFAQ
jgi:hypothetical protein